MDHHNHGFYVLLLFLTVFAYQRTDALDKFQGHRKNTFVYHNRDGYYYHIDLIAPRNVPDTIYLRCVQYESGCEGRALFHAVHGFRDTHDLTIHGPDMLHAQYRVARLNILERCARLEHVPFHRIIYEESRNCHPEVRAMLRRRCVILAMTRARRSAYPPIPRSIHALSVLLQRRNYRGLATTLDGEDNLFCGFVRANDGSEAIVFASRRMLEFMRTTQTVMSDGTFRSVPALPNASQVFTILTTWNHHIVPLVWVLMERRTTSLYRAVLAFLRLISRTWRLRRVITDWERPQRNAWSAIFGDTACLQGCFWHFCRAIIFHARNRLGLHWWIRHDRFVRSILRLLCALPLLPGNLRQQQGLNLITRLIRRRGRFYMNLLRDLLVYISTKWINHHTRRRSLNFNNSYHRTNNACESHNRLLNRHLGVRHPNIYQFIDCLRLMEDTAFNDLQALREGAIPSYRRRASAVSNDRSLRNLTRGLRHAPDRHDNAILRFLIGAANTFRQYANQAIFGNAR